MEININQEHTEGEKKKGKFGCIFIIILLLVALGVLSYFIWPYVPAIKTLLQATQNEIPRTKIEQGIQYQFNNSKYINILLLGSDDDSKFQSANVLTQTIIIVSINTQDKTVNMISIPRDSWVPTVGVSGGFAKIDEVSGLGGFSLTRQTIEKDYGVHIDYYAWVGLQGFEKVIDTFGGIDIDVNHPILDDLYPNDTTGSDPYSAIRIYIPAGPQHLNGQRALEYVRSRHGDLLGDFGRSARQQQVLLNLKDKVENTNIVSKIPELANELQGSIRTDMSITQITGLASLAVQIPQQNIKRYILSPPDYGKNGTSPDGSKFVMNPDFTKINTLFTTLFK